MPYDAALAARIRERLASRTNVTEMDMMGGHQFLIAGRIGLSVRDDALSVRIDPKERERWLAEPHVRPLTIGAKATKGFVRVAADGLRSDRALDAWISVGVRAAGHGSTKSR